MPFFDWNGGDESKFYCLLVDTSASDHDKTVYDPSALQTLQEDLPSRQKENVPREQVS